MSAAWEFWSALAPRSWVPGYLRSRGLDDVVAAYAPSDWTRTLDHLRSRGFTDREILAAGLARTSNRGTLIDPFRNRLMLPIHHPERGIVAFVGRAHPRDLEGHRIPKYVNSPTTDLFSKSDIPYGLDLAAIEALHNGSDLILVEGPLDALAVRTAGSPLVPVAPLGTAITPGHLRTLDQLAPLTNRRLLVAFDNDTAGRAAAIAAYRMLVNHGVTTPQAVNLPAGSDPAQVLSEDGAAKLRQSLERNHPLADLVIDASLADWPRLDYPEQRVRATRDLAAVIAGLADDDRTRQAARVVAALSLDPFTLLDTIDRLLPYEPKALGRLGLPSPPPAVRSTRHARAVLGMEMQSVADHLGRLGAARGSTDLERAPASVDGERTIED